jgi:hypothetical protein
VVRNTNELISKTYELRKRDMTDVWPWRLDPGRLMRRRSSAVSPLMPRSISNNASMRLTASNANGEIAAVPLRRRAFAPISTSSKNCLLAWAQHRAAMIGPVDREGS